MPVVGLGLLWIIVGAGIAGVGLAGWRGRLPRQHWAGIRLPSTMRSDEAWYAAHRAGGPWLAAGGLAPAVVGVLLVAMAPDADAAAQASLALAAWMLAFVIVAGVVGVRAAR